VIDAQPCGGQDSLRASDASSTQKGVAVSSDTVGAPYEKACSLGNLESCFELPDRHLADTLVDAYFDRIHKLYPFVHEGSFRTEYELLWEQPSPIRFRARLSWFGVLNMVFVHACEVCGDFPEEDVLAAATPFLERSRTIILTNVFKLSNVETVQSLLLMCYYLQSTLELTECWNLVGLMNRTAISLGLHMRAPLVALPPVEREVRKRVWWGCVVMDRSLSMKYGRPPSLRTKDSDVELPLEVDDQYIVNDCATPRQPIGASSFISFFISTIKLSQIISNMLKMLYLGEHDRQQSRIDRAIHTAVSRHHVILSNAVLLDGQLQSWWDNLPPQLKLDGTEDQRGYSGNSCQRTVLKIRSV